MAQTSLLSLYLSPPGLYQDKIEPLCFVRQKPRWELHTPDWRTTEVGFVWYWLATLYTHRPVLAWVDRTDTGSRAGFLCWLSGA